MKLVLSSGWSKESWAVKHSNQVLQDLRRRNFCWNAFKISFLRSITDHKYQKGKDQLHQTEPTKPLLGMIIYFLKFLFFKISRRFSPFSRPILLHMPGSPCVWTTPCLLRSPYPAASTTGRFRKVQMTLQCWGGCVHFHQWKVDFAAGILQYMCLSWACRFAMGPKDCFYLGFQHFLFSIILALFVCPPWLPKKSSKNKFHLILNKGVGSRVVRIFIFRSRGWVQGFIL